LYINDAMIIPLDSISL